MKLIFILIVQALFVGTPMDEWDVYEKNIRDQKINMKDAKATFPKLFKEIKDYASKFNFIYDVSWKNPVLGASSNDFTKAAYKPSEYSFFEGNSHGGHPAYDIFILDNNQDCLNDRTKKPVTIIAPVDMLIISINTGWEKTSILRGGNYIWGFNPKADLFFYFAHLDTIKVTKGDFVKKGEMLATLGRTGKNAYPSRSPTHLHFMVLKTDGVKMEPYDSYKHLIK